MCNECPHTQVPSYLHRMYHKNPSRFLKPWIMPNLVAGTAVNGEPEGTEREDAGQRHDSCPGQHGMRSHRGTQKST